MTQTFTTPGMSCGKCATRITNALKSKPGVADVTIDLPAKKVQVTFDDQQVTPAQLATALSDAGYPTQG